MKRRWPARRQGAQADDGVVTIFIALLMTAILCIAAIVIDLGFVRGRTVADQTAADLAAIAAGTALADRDPVTACRDAFASLRVNIAVASIAAPSTCNALGATICSNSAGAPHATASQTVDRFVVTVRYPVGDAAIVDPVFGSGRRDGAPCERMQVTVTSTEPVFFGRLLGRESYTVTRSATVRATYQPSPRVPALWLLDPWGCTSLAVSGGSHVTVGSASPAIPGIVAVDSDGSSCTGSQRTVSSTGSGTLTRAVPTTGSTPGAIDLFAQPRHATTCSGAACDAADVAAGRLSPQPTAAATRATRRPIDWWYNCRSSYPNFHSLPMKGCPSGTPAYVDLLRSGLGTSGHPVGYQRWTAAGRSCNPAGTITVSGNWWIDCPSGLTIGNGTAITLANGNVVLDGGITMTGGTLAFNTGNTTGHLPSACVPPAVQTPCLTQASDAAAFLYLRTGSINVTGGNLTANHVTTILADGFVKIAGGAPPTWLAPLEGPFAGLALWSELPSNKFQINGGAGARLAGTFFTPEAAPFTLSGGGAWGQQHAQFITYQLAVSGGADVTLVPHNLAIPLPAPHIHLIR